MRAWLSGFHRWLKCLKRFAAQRPALDAPKQQYRSFLNFYTDQFLQNEQRNRADILAEEVKRFHKISQCRATYKRLVCAMTVQRAIVTDLKQNFSPLHSMSTVELGSSLAAPGQEALSLQHVSTHDQNLVPLSFFELMQVLRATREHLCKALFQDEDKIQLDKALQMIDHLQLLIKSHDSTSTTPSLSDVNNLKELIIDTGNPSDVSPHWNARCCPEPGTVLIPGSSLNEISNATGNDWRDILIIALDQSVKAIDKSRLVGRE